MKRITTAAFLAATMAAAPAAFGASVTISNPGFESDFTGWTEVEPTAISTSDVHSGTKSAKMQSSTGQVKHTISGLTASTSYALKAWVMGNGRVGARSYGGSEVSTTVNSASFTQVTVNFTTGASNTSAEIFAAWVGGGDARVDDFTLDSTAAATATPTPTPTSPPSATPTPTPTSSGPTVITPGAGGVTASTNDGNVPANTVDNSLATRWSGNGNGAWIRYDLGSSQTVAYVTLGVHMGNTRKNVFDLQVSTDGTSWTNVLTNVQTSGTTTQQQTHDFADVSARYVRYVGHGYVNNGGGTGTWNSLLEVDIYGISGPPTPTPTPGPTATPTPTPTPGGGGSVPADFLNLTNWKETLPINTAVCGASAGQPTEVKQPQLATCSVDPWFRINAAGTAVQFRAAVNGETTSGSSYPRSELREMTNGGATNASWSTTSGTHTMYIDQVVTSLPQTKPHIVVGQIHDSADDVTVFRMESGTLYMTNGNDTHWTTLGSIGVGTRFNVKFEVSGGQIRGYLNGVLKATLAKSTSGCYFKAGAYTQANCTNSSPCSSSNYGEAHIYDVWVTHQ